MRSSGDVEERRKELARDVQRLASLGVRLLDSEDDSVVVQNRAELSLVEVKGKQYNDPILFRLKEKIHKHRTMAFELGEVL